ncbi:MAG: endonuclease/exonuclease/phosphatase family protein [Dermatophilaceae bacterium]
MRVDPVGGATGRTTLRIAGYNTRDFLDDRRAAARVVRAIAPDVLCLQEVPRHPFSGWRVRRFAQECGMSWPGGHRGGGGTTVLTGDRVTTVGARHTRLTVALLTRSRGYAVVRVRPAGRPDAALLTVASVHLSLHAGERHVHTRTILDDVVEAAGGPNRIVLAGDLNEHRSAGGVWRLLESRLRLVSPEAPTYPARRPRAALDVILAAPDVEVLPHPRIVLDEDDLIRASDHRPVWVDVIA